MARLRLNRFEVRKGQLPLVCMFCGERPAAEKRVTFSWHPRWIAFLLLLVVVPPLMVGLVPLVIAMALLTKRMTVHLPVCDEHRDHWRNRRLVIRCGWLLVAAVGIGVMVFLIVASENRRIVEDAVAGSLCVGTLLLAAAWLIFAIVFGRGSLAASEITDRTITLVGVHPAFIEALKQQDEEEDRLYASRTPPRTRPEDCERYYEASPEPPETIREDES